MSMTRVVGAAAAVLCLVACGCSTQTTANAEKAAAKGECCATEAKAGKACCTEMKSAEKAGCCTEAAKKAQ